MNTKLTSIGGILIVYLILQTFLGITNPVINIIGIVIGVYFLSNKNRKEILPIPFSNPLYGKLAAYAYIISNSVLLLMSFLEKKDDENEN